MVAASDIGWGSYRNFEGPYYRGRCPYKLPADPSPSDKVMAVITATEGGKYDAFNGYDGCGWTSGIIQWIEKGQFSVSGMLQDCVLGSDRGAALIDSVVSNAQRCSYVFKPNGRGYYRFFDRISGNEVDTTDEQRKLFYLHCDGMKGNWDEASKAYARAWAAAISTVWEDTEAQRVQRVYTADRLTSFMQPYAKTVFASMPGTDLAHGLRAAYLSFAANNPTWANKALSAGVAGTTAQPWSQDWAIAVLKALTFKPQVAIYPHRYDCIRPVLEDLYGMQLPDLQSELKTWTAETGIPAGIDTKKLQRALLALGYDLGPCKADGKYGKKTRDAVLTLEQLSGMVPEDSQDGMVDVYTYPALCSALEAKGLSFDAV